MKRKADYTLYLCTDRRLMSTATMEEAVEQAVKGGCTVVQLREKECSSREFYQLAKSVKAVTNKYGVPLIINDRVDIALAADADGVHVGQSDLPARVVRKLLGKDKLLGVSAATVEECKRAQADGADYLGIGAMYPTSTKKNTRSVTIEDLQDMRNSVDIPIVAIGGINEKNAENLGKVKINGIAVVSAVIAQPNIERAARELKEIFTASRAH